MALTGGQGYTHGMPAKVGHNYFRLYCNNPIWELKPQVTNPHLKR